VLLTNWAISYINRPPGHLFTIIHSDTPNHFTCTISNQSISQTDSRLCLGITIDSKQTHVQATATQPTTVAHLHRTPTKGWNNTLCKDVGEGESNAEAAYDMSTELSQDERQVHVAQPRVVHLQADMSNTNHKRTGKC